MTGTSGDRQKIRNAPFRRHHRVVSDTDVNVFNDLFLLRIEHLIVAGIGWLIEEAAVRSDRSVLRLHAEADVERPDHLVANRIHERDRPADSRGDEQLSCDAGDA